MQLMILIENKHNFEAVTLTLPRILPSMDIKDIMC